MRGETRKARGKEWRYYTCPVSDGRSWIRSEDGSLMTCNARRVPANAAEARVVDDLIGVALPPETVDLVAEELRSRLAAPAPARLTSSASGSPRGSANSRTLYSWGDMEEAEYRAAKRETETALGALPAPGDMIVVFSRHRAVVQSLGNELAEMAPDDVQEIVALLVERVETQEQRVIRVIPSGPARPFFDAARVGVLAPPDGLEPPTQALGRPRSVH